MNTATRLFKLPPLFVDDCLDCDCDIGAEIKRTKTYVLLACSPEQLAELKSRAGFYASEIRYMEPYLRPLGRSAKRVLAIIDAA